MSDKMNAFAEFIISDRELYDAVSQSMSKVRFLSANMIWELDDPENSAEVRKMFNNIIESNSYGEDTEEKDRVYYDRIIRKLNQVCNHVWIILDN